MDPVVAIVLALFVLVAATGAAWLRSRRRNLPGGRESLPRATSSDSREAAGEPTAGDTGRSAPAGGERPEATPAAPEAATAGPAAPAAEASAEDVAERQMAVYKKGLAHTRSGFVARLARLFVRTSKIDATVLDEIEEVLIMADIGVRTTSKILDNLRVRVDKGEVSTQEQVWAALREETLRVLDRGDAGLHIEQHRPSVILVVGVNGVGKTTTIGKLASHLQQQGKRVLLAAGDTFRAAAVAQLEVWGRRVGCPVVTGKEGADPGSVVFEAIKQAENEGIDVVIADTAGRLHTKAPLMDELRKVGRTTTKALGGRAADEILLVLDATTGQNAVQQAHMFRQALDLTGVVLTKLDGTAKGGVILGIVDEHQLPVRFIGLGERIEDLREFDASTFVDALFARSEDEDAAA